MPKENNKVDINKHENDIDTLFKQNVNDLSAIKELYRKLEEVEERFTQIKYIDSTLAYKLKKEYEKLKKIILDENIQIKLTNDIESINSRLETIANNGTTVEVLERVINDIESINSRLETIANKGTTVEVLERVIKEEIDRQVAAGTIANLTIKDNGVTSEKIKKGAILLEHESWLNITKLNIFDESKATVGKYLNVNGDILNSPSGTLLHSDYIEVDEGKKYFNSNTRVICFYDSNKTYISGLNTNDYTNPFTVPAGVKYVRIVYNKSDTKVLCEGDTLIDPNASFGDYKLSWNSTEFKNLIKETSNNEICTSGMNMIVFGDSITATASMNDDGTNYKEVTTNWPTYTKESLKVSGFKNFGRAGAAYRYRSDVEFRQSLTNQVQIAIDNNVAADIIVFSAGTNDWEANMGTFDTAMSKTTLDDLDITKTYEAIRWCFWKIKKHFPNAICFVATPIQRADVEPFYKIIEAIIKMAERYNFIVIPAHSESGIIRDFETQGASGKWLYDGLHPGENGKKMMGKLYTRVILNSLQNYI